MSMLSCAMHSYYLEQNGPFPQTVLLYLTRGRRAIVAKSTPHEPYRQSLACKVSRKRKKPHLNDAAGYSNQSADQPTLNIASSIFCPKVTVPISLSSTCF